MSFKRENRYLVIKRSDIHRYLSRDDEEQLELIACGIEAEREMEGRQPLECVVVESDWAEYEPTWAAIQARVESDEQDSGYRLAP
jgi:hypothetical protein